MFPWTVFLLDLPDGSFKNFPPKVVNEASIDEETARKIAKALVEAKAPIIHVGGGVIFGHASEELTALVDWLEIPVTHTLMGKGAISDVHP